MTPKEKADQLVFHYWDLNYGSDGDTTHALAKKGALIAVEETIRTLHEDIRDLDVRGNVLLDLIEYWEAVKQEIKQELEKP